MGELGNETDVADWGTANKPELHPTSHPLNTNPGKISDRLWSIIFLFPENSQNDYSADTFLDTQTDPRGSGSRASYSRTLSLVALTQFP
jgi:hypothetical protein